MFSLLVLPSDELLLQMCSLALVGFGRWIGHECGCEDLPFLLKITPSIL